MKTETWTLIDMRVEISFLVPTSDIGEAEDRAADTLNKVMNGDVSIPAEVDYTVEPTDSVVNPKEPEVQQVNAWTLGQETSTATRGITREDVYHAVEEISHKLTDADLELLTRSLAEYRAKRFLLDLQEVINLDWDDLEMTRKEN